MFQPLFIGDRVTASGFRLGGAMVVTPEPGSETKVFNSALETNNLILITAQVAACLPESLLEKTQITGSPLVLVIPDIRGFQQADNVADRLRRLLGMTE